MTRSQKCKPIIIAALAAMAVAGIGGLMTDIGPWYLGLVKPSWQPPDWLFGPAWTLIFSLAAASGVIAWRDAPNQASREWMLALFALNGFLNVLWSLLFFKLRRPDWALMEVGFLWLSVALLMVVLGRYSRKASWLLAPYLVWIAFAAALNGATARLNGPF
jgi:translocator protein